MPPKHKHDDAPNVQTGAIVRIGEAEYPLDDLDFNELCELEDTLGTSMQETDWSSARAMRQLVYTFRRRAEPELTLEQAGRDMRLRDFNQAETEGRADPPA